MRTIGYWREQGIAGLFDRNPDPHDQLDVNWDLTERARVVEHLKRGRVHEAWFGYSYCRFNCGIPDCDMGSRDLTDGDYVWPEGYVHYVEMHYVKPPEQFVQHVLRACGLSASSMTSCR